jgi:quercetin 2,3-dioxygenase
MINVRKSDKRGSANHGWLDSRFTFSFADYFDRNNMNFGPLRVINEDWIQPSGGFPTHPHNDMEIITYVLEGEIAHKDSMWKGAVLKRGDVQRMSAGTGITHSEFNNSSEIMLHLFQIWIIPDKNGYEPRYEDRTFNDDQKLDQLLLIASNDGRESSFDIHQDVDFYASIMSGRKDLVHTTGKGRGVLIQLASGNLVVNGTELFAGDVATITEEEVLNISAKESSEFILFDLNLS